MEKSFKQAEVSEASIENKTEGNIQENILSVVEVLKKKIAAIETLNLVEIRHIGNLFMTPLMMQLVSLQVYPT